MFFHDLNRNDRVLTIEEPVHNEVLMVWFDQFNIVVVVGDPKLLSEGCSFGHLLDQIDSISRNSD